ncbi:MAG: MBL fold metallo-hydrolase [Chloroflexota bacterium]
MSSLKKITVLGAGTPTPTKDRFGSSIVVKVNDELIMFDCGPATTHKLIKAGISITKVDYLFFSHHHFDHDVDYPCFLLTRWDQGAGKEKTLRVLGPNPTEEFTENLIGEEGVFSHDWKARVGHPVSQQIYVNRGGTLPRKPPVVNAENIKPDSTYKFDGWDIHTAEAKHVQPYLDSLAYRMETDDFSLVYTGDTEPCESVEKLSQGADMMICMCWDEQSVMDKEKENTGQCGTLGAASMAATAEVKHLVLTHMGPNISKAENMQKSLREIREVYSGKVTFADEITDVNLNY